MQPRVNELPIVFGVFTPNVDRIGNVLAVFVNQILDGALFYVLQLMKGK